MSLELTGRAAVKHINLRKEGPREEQSLAVDIKLACTTSAAILAYFHPTLRSFLFNDAGEPRIPQLEPISLDGSLKNMDLKLDGLEVWRAELKKFVFEPLSGEKVALSFSASFEPVRAQLATLAELLGREIALEVKPEGGGLPLGSAEFKQRFETELTKRAKEKGFEVDRAPGGNLRITSRDKHGKRKTKKRSKRRGA